MTSEAVSLTSRSYGYNHHLVLIVALLFLVSSSPEAVVAGEAAASSPPACKVTINDKDMTDELFVVDNSYENNDDKERRYVNCMGRSKCRDAIITNCPRIKCYESEACNNARIIDFTESVLCEGMHACHRTNMTLAAAEKTTEETTIKTKVSCIGSEACDVAQISGEIDEIEFVGVKAGRKVHVEDAKVIKCRDGHDTNKACDSLATFVNVRCLYCGQNGCSDHINTCRYKFAGGDDDTNNDSSWMQYEKCNPEKVLGPNCPAGLENELRMELTGKEEIEVVGLSSEEKEEGDDDNGRKNKKRGIRGLLRRGSSD